MVQDLGGPVVTLDDVSAKPLGSAERSEMISGLTSEPDKHDTEVMR
jgi:hypothetical protein